MKEVLIVIFLVGVSIVVGANSCTQVDGCDISTWDSIGTYGESLTHQYTPSTNGKLVSWDFYVIDFISAATVTITFNSVPSSPTIVADDGSYTVTWTPGVDVVAGYPYTVTWASSADNFEFAMSTMDCPNSISSVNNKRDVYDPYFRATIECSSSSSGDPHFFGFSGQKYDVMGQSYEIYNLITSPYLQINSRFIPYFRLPDQVVPTGTMMGEIGIKFSTHQLYLNSNSSFAVLDSNEISMKSPWSMTFDDVTISNKLRGNKYELEFDSSEVSITFIQKLYSHKGLADQWHYDYKASLHKTNQPQLHGLLGQTWEDKYFEDKASDAFKYLDGAEEDYRIITNDIFGDSFKFNKFRNM